MFLEISQNSQENTFASICNFIEKQTLAQVFSFKFYEISKSTFFVEQIQKIASAMLLSYRNQSVDLQSKWGDLFLYDWKASLNILFPNILIDCITEK